MIGIDPKTIAEDIGRIIRTYTSTPGGVRLEAKDGKVFRDGKPIEGVSDGEGKMWYPVWKYPGVEVSGNKTVRKEYYDCYNTGKRFYKTIEIKRGKNKPAYPPFQSDPIDGLLALQKFWNQFILCHHRVNIATICKAVAPNYSNLTSSEAKKEARAEVRKRFKDKYGHDTTKKSITKAFYYIKKDKDKPDKKKNPKK